MLQDLSKWTRKRKGEKHRKLSLLHRGSDARVYLILHKGCHKVLKSISLSGTSIYCAHPGRIKKIRGQCLDGMAQLCESEDLIVGRPVRLQYGYVDTNQDDSTRLILADTFCTEAAVITLLTTHCVPLGAHFIPVSAIWSTAMLGHMIMRDVGIPLHDIIYDMDLESLKSVVIQVLVTLHIGQRAVRFKHHDLHLGNVLVTNTAGPRTMDSGLVQLPPSKYTATIGDFGLSSATDPASKSRIGRADYDLLSKESGWGTWSCDLENFEGYDVAYFLFCLVDSFVGKKSSAQKEWCSSLMKHVRECDPHVRMTRERGRPSGHVRVRPEDMIRFAMK